MIETSGHLPECPHTEPDLNPGFLVMCICDRLRACEQRVRNQDIATHHADLQEAKALLASRDEAWYAGVDAAWIAVGNVPCATTTHGDDFRDIPGPIVKRNALAAIDALREEQK